ncbi:MAG: hypothetical protein WCJ88_04975 [Actinomycetes bacterium]
MAKTLAGILAVSIAALLLAGCGDSKPSPAQLEEEKCERLNKTRRDLENEINRLKDKGYSTIIESQSLQRTKREIVAAGC